MLGAHAFHGMWAISSFRAYALHVTDAHPYLLSKKGAVFCEALSPATWVEVGVGVLVANMRVGASGVDGCKGVSCPHASWAGFTEVGWTQVFSAFGESGSLLQALVVVPWDINMGSSAVFDDSGITLFSWGKTRQASICHDVCILTFPQFSSSRTRVLSLPEMTCHHLTVRLPLPPTLYFLFTCKSDSCGRLVSWRIAFLTVAALQTFRVPQILRLPRTGIEGFCTLWCFFFASTTFSPVAGTWLGEPLCLLDPDIICLAPGFIWAALCREPCFTTSVQGTPDIALALSLVVACSVSSALCTSTAVRSSANSIFRSTTSATSAFKAVIVFCRLATMAACCSWVQTEQWNGDSLLVRAWKCVEDTPAQQRWNQPWHFPSQKRASSFPSTIRLQQTTHAELGLDFVVGFSLFLPAGSFFLPLLGLLTLSWLGATGSGSVVTLAGEPGSRDISFLETGRPFGWKDAIPLALGSSNVPPTAPLAWIPTAFSPPSSSSSATASPSFPSSASMAAAFSSVFPSSSLSNVSWSPGSLLGRGGASGFFLGRAWAGR